MAVTRLDVFDAPRHPNKFYTSGSSLLSLDLHAAAFGEVRAYTRGPSTYLVPTLALAATRSIELYDRSTRGNRLAIARACRA